jgi:hypothetical protein
MVPAGTAEKQAAEPDWSAAVAVDLAAELGFDQT